MNPQDIKDILTRVAVGGGVGAGTLGLGSYLMDDSQNPEKRMEKAKQRAMIGAGLGMAGGLGYDALRRLTAQVPSDVPKPPADVAGELGTLRVLSHPAVAKGAVPAAGAGLGLLSANREKAQMMEKAVEQLKGKTPEDVVSAYKEMPTATRQNQYTAQHFVDRVLSTARSKPVGSGGIEFERTFPSGEIGPNAGLNVFDKKDPVNQKILDQLKQLSKSVGKKKVNAQEISSLSGEVKKLVREGGQKNMPTGGKGVQALLDALGGEAIAGKSALPLHSKLWNMIAPQKYKTLSLAEQLSKGIPAKSPVGPTAGKMMRGSAYAYLANLIARRYLSNDLNQRAALDRAQQAAQQP